MLTHTHTHAQSNTTQCSIIVMTLRCGMYFVASWLLSCLRSEGEREQLLQLYLLRATQDSSRAKGSSTYTMSIARVSHETKAKHMYAYASIFFILSDLRLKLWG